MHTAYIWDLEGYLYMPYASHETHRYASFYLLDEWLSEGIPF